MTTLNLRQGLRVKIVMIEIKLAATRDMGAAVLPTRKCRKEIIRRSKLDIEIDFFLQCGNCLEKPSRLWLGL